MKTITEDQFHEQFTFEENLLDPNASFDGYMFETFGDELDYVMQIQNDTPNRIWTIIEGESGELFYMTGFHLVNRMGFLISNEPWNEETIVECDDILEL